MRDEPLVTLAGTPLAPGFYLTGLAIVSALVVRFSFQETARLPLTRTTVLES
ncbi:hypothetical protein [Streptomyces sp. CoT10]|uniref:hypothetical protein n=1 Tax=Streptomyces sp. CoT10 TaxID=2875762 RepID=UPI001CD4CF10|nr:hypothetical protein [Streptomyces sp. CoT10]